jgi:2-methylcitrate dehydratase PrpD
MADTVLGQLAEQWSNLTFADLPQKAIDVGKQCILDWMGCALAGSQERLVELLRQELGSPGPATLIGAGRQASPRDAALINGAAGHALDFDDTHTLLSGHPSAPVIPAALATAEELDLSGEALLTALVVGIEVECRVGALLAPGHYRAGWHATATIGIMGAAAAVAHLLGLEAQRTTHALALAATQAGGLKASFGTMAKPLHAGKAATDGLLAARLAARGFTGNPAVLEALQGLAAATGAASETPSGAGTLDLDLNRLKRLANRWTIRDTLFKYHAACYLTHASINAAQALSGKITVGEIEQVEVHVAADSLQVCNIARPSTGLEGKFSLRATTAMALLGDDTSDMSAYTDGRMQDDELVALRDRVRVVAHDAGVGTQSRVVVTMRDGSVLEAEDDTGRPAEDLHLQGQRLLQKFAGLAGPVLGEGRAIALAAAVMALAPARKVGSLAAA